MKYSKSSIHQQLMGLYITRLFLTAVILVFGIGVSVAMLEKPLYGVLLSLFCAAYYVYLAISTYLAAERGNLLSINGIVVSSESQKATKFAGKSTTYRIVPIDEDGEVIEENGSLDFFITVDDKSKKDRYFIGATYCFIFDMETVRGQEISAKTMVYHKRLEAKIGQKQTNQEQGTEKNTAPDNSHRDNLTYLTFPEKQ